MQSNLKENNLADKRLQSLYNTYLYASRVNRGNPFSPRKDFSDFDPEKALLLQRINNLLIRYDHIDPKDYFDAPYKIYPEEALFDLSFYASMSAVKAYSLLKKQQDELPPDSEYQLQKIAESLKFIAHFCIKHDIPLSEYIDYKTGLSYDWMKHFKNHQITLYVIMGFDGSYDKIASVPEDQRYLLIGDVDKHFISYKTKYMKSTLAKHLVVQGLEKVKKSIEASRKSGV